MDLADLLKQCEGTNVNVYTHREVLPAHMYPKLRNHPNMGGHYGGAWQEQKDEFTQFSGPVIATTNCILIPRPAYADRVFTTRVTAVPGGVRLKDNDFSSVIAKALTCAPLPEKIVRTSTVGFHRQDILDAAPTIVQAVKDGNISRFFVIGGCDGVEPGRNYFSDYARATPKDSFILTLGCGKYRIRDYNYGEHLGLPRLMDMRQCNDAYGAIAVTVALANAFECGVNDLPLTLVVSWFRAESRRRPAHAPLARREEHHRWAEPAGVRLAERLQDPAREVRLAIDRQREGRPRGGPDELTGELAQRGRCAPRSWRFRPRAVPPLGGAVPNRRPQAADSAADIRGNVKRSELQQLLRVFQLLQTDTGSAARIGPLRLAHGWWRHLLSQRLARQGTVKCMTPLLCPEVPRQHWRQPEATGGGSSSSVDGRVSTYAPFADLKDPESSRWSEANATTTIAPVLAARVSTSPAGR